jgi:hypothetical protein
MTTSEKHARGLIKKWGLDPDEVVERLHGEREARIKAGDTELYFIRYSELRNRLFCRPNWLPKLIEDAGEDVVSYVTKWPIEVVTYLLSTEEGIAVAAKGIKRLSCHYALYDALVNRGRHLKYFDGLAAGEVWGIDRHLMFLDVDAVNI